MPNWIKQSAFSEVGVSAIEEDQKKIVFKVHLHKERSLLCK